MSLNLYYGPLISPAATKGFLDYQAKLMQLGAKPILKARKVSNSFNLGDSKPDEYYWYEESL